MQSQISELRTLFHGELSQANLNEEASVENLRLKYLGKKGLVTDLLKGMGTLSAEERPLFGKQVNELKAEVLEAIEQAKEKAAMLAMEKKLSVGRLDISLPGQGYKLGSTHPLYDIREEIIDFFANMGFHVDLGRDIETDWYNFEALNTPKDHPSRDMQDTFYLSQNATLRSQTSGTQIHYMETHKPPIRMIAPGHVFRVDADATHAPMFQQCEGLVVDENISFAQLKGTLAIFTKKLFGENTKTRFRPSFFPFTEPSAELDVSCVFCGGKGCRKCKGTGWMEIAGCGSVDPAVFQNVGIDPEKYTGFAFGFGLDRIAMLRHQIPEISLLTSNDQRFLEQF
uniref:Phenylalanine--tRNA ligase alpha subunit n=1 Tax=uncultured bacterium contig00085 TaxID=1181558 RepID=A0A806KHF6_9BACT|nr:phenylalanyl-tRNA synthetase alpha chain [uncultured bacterium contig00085]